MTQVKQLHDAAMNFADQALHAKRSGDSIRAAILFRSAFEQEQKAVAVLLGSGSPSEPIRSVLCRSAATLALDCGDTDEAARLVALGLDGAPPKAIRLE